MDDVELELRLTFLDEAAQMLDETEQCFLKLEDDQTDSQIIEKIFRLAHNLKGSAGAVGFVDIASLTHEFESAVLKVKNGDAAITPAVTSTFLACGDRLRTMIDGLKNNTTARFDTEDMISKLKAALERGELPATEKLVETSDQSDETTAIAIPPAKAAHAQAHDEYVRVSLARLDRLMNDIGELVILQAVLDQHRHLLTSPLLQKTVAQLNKITKTIRDTALSVRMVSVRPMFQKMHRIVRDTSLSLGKDVVLKLTGEDHEVDKTILDAVGDALVHLIRNAVDHGVETPEEREQAGKPRQGVIDLKATLRNEQVVIEIKDDGKGLDPERLIAKARGKGLIGPEQKLTAEQAYQLVFLPGFSTKEQVTQISGRGVGMDVVKTQVEILSGKISVASQLGQGTSFILELPLTLSIIDAMIVRQGNDRYVFPLSGIRETLRPGPDDVSKITGGGELLRVRDEVMPALRLDRILKSDQSLAEERPTAIVSRAADGSTYAVLVNEILGQQQVVIKSMGEELSGLTGVAGAAVLGDGRPALIIDLASLPRYGQAARVA